jgi:deazaflavin-dependent oxidoreductase (nitroreductase family)
MASIPDDMKEYNRSVVADYRAAGGHFTGRMEGRSILILTTHGRRSRELRTVVLGYGREGDRFVVIASNNGAPHAPAWYRNLQANTEVTVEIEGDRFDARASTIPDVERARYAELIPWLPQQQGLTERQIPLVALDRVR